ncbi:HAD family hydrolase [Cellulomonas timonensis]|uniref:HAD family hydrolase n=1 Tax=Cellulomonas timonensis TaxID=1689271 RepID=UPI00082C55A0|nr:HAD family hydrolase [Cellulomonas timonensis]
MREERPRAVLFDIDGTLAVGSSAHLAALVATAWDVLRLRVDIQMVGERPHLDDQDVTGWIDSQVLRLLRDRAQAEGRAPLDALVERYVATYADALADGTALVGRPVPGAAHVLDALRSRGTPLGLVTGNVHGVARLKLTGLGLDRGFSFHRDGGFGDWRAGRAELPAAAGQRLGIALGPEVWLVGDTCADMAGAKGAGLTAVGVLTGGDDEEELRAAGADVVLRSVADLP